jgi:hypothetical protein
MRGIKEELWLLGELKRLRGVYFAVDTGYIKHTESLAIQTKPVPVKDDHKIGVEVAVTTIHAPLPVENGDIDLYSICIQNCIKEAKSDNYYQRLLACVQLAYLGDPSTTSSLEELAVDSNFYVRAAAAKALRDIKHQRFRIEELAGISLALCDKWLGELGEGCISEDGKVLFVINWVIPPYNHLYLEVST